MLSSIMSVRSLKPVSEPNHIRTYETKRSKKKMEQIDKTYDKLMWAVASTLADAKHEFIFKPNGKNSEQLADCMISDVVDTIIWLHNNNVIDGNGFINYIKQFVYVHDGIYDGQIPTLKEN